MHRASTACAFAFSATCHGKSVHVEVSELAFRDDPRLVLNEVVTEIRATLVARCSPVISNAQALARADHTHAPIPSSSYNLPIDTCRGYVLEEDGNVRQETDDEFRERIKKHIQNPSSISVKKDAPWNF
jgi:hypothetical protein